MFVQKYSQNLLIVSGSMVLLCMINLFLLYLLNNAKSQVNLEIKSFNTIKDDTINRPFNPAHKGAPKRTSDGGSRT